VNHRYFDLNIKMPKIFNPFESAIRALLKEYMQRGKTDLYITYENYSEENSVLRYNHLLAGQYLKYCREIRDEFGLPDDIRVSTIASFPEVIEAEKADEDDEKMWSLLSDGIRRACEQFVSAREKEGENLKNDLLEKLDRMSVLVAGIEERAPEIIKEYRAKLEAKVREMLADSTIDEGRIATEVTIYADRICVDEETVRLKSHIEAARQELLKGDAVGRKLDFLAQEMNREVNTTLSKSPDLKIADDAIELKTEVEKIREQVQNIE
jgi:uncharacterized protein (TIGR00255 family)